MGRSQYSNCESEPNNMAKESSADAPVNAPATVNPLAKPAQNSQQAGLSESAAAETQAVKLPADATPAQKSPHLLTPLASLWPTATKPEPPRAPETAVKPAAPQTVKVTFVLLEPGAKQVFLCGEFNGWASDATPMKRDDAGHWETTLALAPGRYEHKFIVDGDWKHDPLARVNVWSQNGTLNSAAQVWP
jgi:hypothetical protein